MAFGTGNHETTYLMISEMLKLDLEGKELLDMGAAQPCWPSWPAERGETGSGHRHRRMGL